MKSKGMSAAECMDGNAQLSHKSIGHKPELDHIQLHFGENGGHIAEHHFINREGPYTEPKQFPFSKNEGKQLLAHLTEHGKINAEGAKEEKPGEAEEDSDSAAGAAS
jgi:hypothetical protein